MKSLFIIFAVALSSWLFINFFKKINKKEDLPEWLIVFQYITEIVIAMLSWLIVYCILVP